MGELTLLPSRPLGSASATANTTRRAPAPYRYPPLALLLTDLGLVIRNLAYAPNIVIPMRTINRKAEQYVWSAGNAGCVLLHALLVVVGLASLALIPAFVLLPGVVWLAWAVVWTLLVVALSMPLNGKAELVGSCGKFVDQNIKGEKWLFVNGVMCGKWWTQCAVDELERRFCRQVTGIHNRTQVPLDLCFGLVLDLIQCMIQRDLGYTSRCVRDTYQELRSALLLKNATNTTWAHRKVVVIAHSQGALILSLVLDMLYADLADEVVGRLEVFTFGCAANHFNNPPNTYNPGTPTATRCPTIKHLEHYANEYDFVARFGVLAYRPDTSATRSVTAGRDSFLTWGSAKRTATVGTGGADGENQFAGKIFLRKGGSGHQFVGHYLDSMFGGTDNKDGSEGETVFVDRDASVRPANENMYLKNGTNGHAANGSDTAYEGNGHAAVVSNGAACQRDEANMSELSRLWGYRGGRVQSN